MRTPLALYLSLSACLAAGLETGVAVRADEASFHSNKYPQAARLGDGRLFAVFSTTAKGDGNGRIYGVFSSDGAKTWSAPKLLLDDPAMNDGDPNILVGGSNVWVFGTRVAIPNDIRKSAVIVIRSTDNGATWSAPRPIPVPRQYITGKRHNGIQLQNGMYAVGISWDLWAEKGMAARTEGEMSLASGVLLSADGDNWTLHGNVYTQADDKVRPSHTNGLCEPSIVQLHSGEILMILRAGGSHHYESRSQDGGLTWSYPVPSALIGSNTPSALCRNEKKPDEIVAVWNNSPLNRWPLVTSLSSDGGKTWSKPRLLANPGRPASYPGITQLTDGTFVAVWQEFLANGGRDIRYGRFTREWLLGVID